MIPHELEKVMVELGEEKAAAKAAAYLLEKEVKSVYAEQYMKARSDKSQGDAAQYAYTTQEYKNAVKRASEALARAETARVHHDAYIARFEAWRSLNSSKRAQIQQGIHH